MRTYWLDSTTKGEYINQINKSSSEANSEATHVEPFIALGTDDNKSPRSLSPLA